MLIRKFLSARGSCSERRRALPGWVGGIAILAAMFIAQPLLAQQTGQITGTVTSAQQALGLGDVQVSIPGTGLGTLTNQDGRFLILNVPVGEHLVLAQLIGYG